MLVDLMNEGLLAHMIGDLVSKYLLNTNRVQRSIELCNEHLFLLNKTELKNTNELVTSCKRSAYLYMTRGYFYIKNYANALKWGQKFLDSSRESGRRILEGSAMFSLAALNNFQCNYNEAKELCAKALSIVKETGEKELEALCYKAQGHNLKSLGEYVEAKEYLEKGIEFAKEVGDWYTEATCCSFLGDTYKCLCEYVKAKIHYEKALAVAEGRGDRKLEARCYKGLGHTFQSLCEYVKAKESFENALVIAGENGDKELEAICYRDLGDTFQSLCEYVKAQESFEKALVIAGKNGNKELEATCYERLGDTFQSLCEYVKAKESFENALVIAGENGDKKLEAACYERLGDTFQSLCEYAKAKESFDNALVIARENGDKELEAICYRDLGDTFQSLCEYVKAEESFENALVIAGENGDKKLQAACYERLGNTFHSLCQYVKAKESFENALAIAEKNGYRELEALCYGELGQTFRSLYEYAKAKESLEKALVIAKENGNKKLTAQCYRGLGGTFMSLNEYVKAKESLEKALVIAKENGNKNQTALCYRELGETFKSLCEYVKAKQSFENALEIAEKNGYREVEAECYHRLGNTISLLRDYVNAKEYYEKSLAIARKIGYKKLEAECYEALGHNCFRLREYVKSIENYEKGHAIAEEIGDRQLEVLFCIILGNAFRSEGKHFEAKEYFEKSLAIAKKSEDWYLELRVLIYSNLEGFETIGEDIRTKEYNETLCAIAEEMASRKTEAACFGNQRATYEFLRSDVKAKGYDETDEAKVYTKLAFRFMSHRNYTEAAEYFNKALALYRQIGDIEQEALTHRCISRCLFLAGNITELKSFLQTSINKSERIRNSLQDHDQFKVSFLEHFVDSYRELSQLLCGTGNPYEGIYIEEFGRARALADLMSAQYSVAKPMSVDLQKWVGLERILEKESNCACLYTSYYDGSIMLWVLTGNNPCIYHQHKHVADYFEGKNSVDDVFCGEIYRKVRCLASERCEDRSWFPSNAYPDKVCESSQEKSLAASRLTFSSEVDEDEEQPISTLADVYKMMIAPVASLLDKPEIIIVPDRLFFKVPFAALKNESGNYLSENIRIRIVPSLTTLQVIQDSPTDYHSQTGALIVGNPDVGEVLYKGNLCQVSRLPFAGEEAEMIGKLLDAQPLLGKRATKEAVLNNIKSVSLIHFACHGDAERGEIVLAPPTLTDRKPQEDDYLLRMADISQVQLRAKLVVLSCCHSAEGQINAEGVVGIARAFIGSGARSVLAALWAIDDKATKQLMSRFYEHLAHGESASESLHQAMKWMRANGFSEVERWAPFMLIGDNVTLDVHKLRLVETD